MAKLSFRGHSLISLKRAVESRKQKHFVVTLSRLHLIQSLSRCEKGVCKRNRLRVAIKCRDEVCGTPTGCTENGSAVSLHVPHFQALTSICFNCKAVELPDLGSLTPRVISPSGVGSDLRADRFCASGCQIETPSRPTTKPHTALVPPTHLLV